LCLMLPLTVLPEPSSVLSFAARLNLVLAKTLTLITIVLVKIITQSLSKENSIILMNAALLLDIGYLDLEILAL